MSILIKGMDFILERRQPDCPLVEVPPHGRLIDADALIGAESTSLIKTNADRIRAMTDEELADWFGSSEAFCPTGYFETSECDACPENCIKHWLFWLKQEVAE